MKVNAITNTNQFAFRGLTSKKDDFLEKFHTATKNSADMTDTIVVPRTIFKGYLGIMTGTTLLSISGLFTNKLPKISKTLSFQQVINF